MSDMRSDLQNHLDNGEWTARFPARPVSKAFCKSEYLEGVAYEPFRNLVLERASMAAEERKPGSADEVLAAILAA